MMEESKGKLDFWELEKGYSEKDINVFDIHHYYGQRTVLLLLKRIENEILVSKFQKEVDELKEYFSVNSGNIEELNQKYDELITKIKAAIVL